MIKKKPYDGVVTAVHYSPDGNIAWVRAFERHGFVFTDRMNLSREALIERLKEGKKFKTGVRKTYQGSDFEVDGDLQLIEKNGGYVITAGQAAEKDSLGNLPIL